MVPTRREGLVDARTLDAPCLALALSHVDEQFILDGRIVDVSFQLAVEAECVVEVEIEGHDNRLRECVQATRVGYLECSIDVRRERSSKNQGLGIGHVALT